MAERATQRLCTAAWFGGALVLLGGICIGYAPIGLRLSELGPQATAFWRYTLALPLLFALTLATEHAPPTRPRPREAAAILIAGTCFALDIALWHQSLLMTSVANATFIVNTGSVGVGLLAWLVLKERLTRLWFIAALLALIGAALLSAGARSPDAALSATRWQGDALAMVAAFLVGAYMVWSKQARVGLGAFSVLFWITLTEAIIAAAVTVSVGERFLPETPAGWAVVASLALIAHAGGQGFIMAGIGLTSAGVAGLLVLIQPVVAAALSWALFAEALTPLQFLGGAVILVGIALAQRLSVRKA